MWMYIFLFPFPLFSLGTLLAIVYQPKRLPVTTAEGPLGLATGGD